ncbi:MAG: hypothetical protein IAE66_04520 [Xanthomonadaceae bacterium]|nr:hypothetical protein [Xanthomonadaceae bacterium]
MRASVSLLLIPLLLAAGHAWAGDARIGVHAKPGEMVLLRNVDARHAYRPQPPGIALIVDPTPTREVQAVHQAGEMTDADFAAMVGGTTTRTTEVTQSIGNVLGVATDGNTNARVDSSGVAGMGALNSPLGAIGGVTGGIGASVKGALSQFPLGTKPGGGP